MIADQKCAILLTTSKFWFPMSYLENTMKSSISEKNYEKLLIDEKEKNGLLFRKTWTNKRSVYPSLAKKVGSQTVDNYYLMFLKIFLIIAALLSGLFIGYLLADLNTHNISDLNTTLPLHNISDFNTILPIQKHL